MRKLLLLLAALPAWAESPLLAVRRIYVDKLTGGETAAQMRDLLIASLQATGRFTLTEREDRADAILRGAAEDLVFTDTYQSSESLSASASMGRNASTRDTGLRSARVGVGQNEAVRIAERRHEALATVRLVDREGDVIWSTTQESQGAKFRGASADVADRITRKLLADLDKK